MIFFARVLFFLLLCFLPSWAFVADFSKLASSEKDKIFTFVTNQISSGASLQDLKNSAYPYTLKAIRDSSGTTLIHYAVWENLIPAVKLLHEQGLSLDSKTDAGIPPLQIAIFRKNLSMVKFLLDSNANINIRNNNGQTPLIIATIVGDKDIVLSLLERRPRTDIRDNNGMSALTQAVADNNTELSFLYIDKGLDVNARTTFNRTPLHFAVQNNNVEISQKLLEAGAFVSPRDYDLQTPNTPLDILDNQVNPVNISNSSERIRALLLDHGAKKAKPYYSNNFSLSAFYSFGSPFTVRALGWKEQTPVQVQYTGLNLRYYVSPELSLSWSYAYGVSLDHRKHGFFMAPGGLLALQDLFAFFQINYGKEIKGPARGFYYTLLGLSALLPEGISWDIRMPSIPYMSFSVEIDWARTHYIFPLQEQKHFNIELTAELQGRLNLLFAEHFLMSFNINAGFSYTRLKFVWGLGMSLGALF